jgi:uncharacterized protein (DUF305 family)
MLRAAVASLPVMLLTADCAKPTRSAAVAGPRPASAIQTTPAAIAKARADSMRLPYTEADVRFMQGMIGHHAQAIVMAGWAHNHAATTSIRRLADRVVNGQVDEIASMQQWLRDRNQVVPEARATGMRMVMNGVEHDMLMPGMLTDAQMAQLDKARGAEFDRLFLTFMIQHHRGAVSMVQELFGSYGAAQDQTVFKFANDVSVDQTTEIARMEKMLAALTPTSRN